MYPTEAINLIAYKLKMVYCGHAVVLAGKKTEISDVFSALEGL